MNERRLHEFAKVASVLRRGSGDRTFVGRLRRLRPRPALPVSDDGTTWRTLATGTGVGQSTEIDARRTHARHPRITSTGAAGNWWSIADIRLHGCRTAGPRIARPGDRAHHPGDLDW